MTKKKTKVILIEEIPGCLMPYCEHTDSGDYYTGICDECKKDIMPILEKYDLAFARGLWD